MQVHYEMGDAKYVCNKAFIKVRCGKLIKVLRRAHTGTSSSRVQQYMFENTLFLFGASAHQVGYLSNRRSYPLCFTAWSYVSGFVGLGKGECDYVNTHNSTDRCRAKHKASLVTKIICLTCRWVAHNNCDISPSS
ncbi:hypothetical protein PoB_002326200 [Plakobranchus ocellatus]|uniref:Uncharacterized protein n=1 Tax=Plakobranchus ocellatus TaxID=259542 RepID=A0AAV3ZQI9_9GAST|nr:hypothetical protein PoB_002326200 [Plakobranchus ocellatus]